MSDESPATANEFTLAEHVLRRRRSHFSKDLWVALALLLGVFGGMVWLCIRARQQHDLVVQVRAAGGRVAHDWEWSGGKAVPDRSPPWWTEVLTAFPSGPEFFSKVVYVNLSGSTKADGAMVAVSQLGDLRGLDLSGAQVLPDVCRYLVSLRELQELNVSGLSLVDSGLAHLGKLSQLRNLNLSTTSLTDAGLLHLRGLSNIDQLDLSQTRVTDEGLKVLAGLPNLESLTLDDTGVTDAGLSHLSSLESLRWLSINGTRTTVAGINSLKQRLRGLKVIKSD